MWTHADTLWTDAECPQKCGKMQTVNADSTKTHSMQRAFNEKRYTVLHIHLQSGEWAQYFEAIKLALLPVNYLAGINLVDTADNFGQKMWTDADCLQSCRKMQTTCRKMRTNGGKREWKSFDIERLCLIIYLYLRMAFPICFSHMKVHMVHII